MSFEVKCDAKGCSQREVLGHGGGIGLGGPLPLGWRTVSFDDLQPATRNAALEKLKKDYVGKHMADYIEAATKAFGSPVSQLTRHRTKHLCPEHALPEFVNNTADDGIDAEFEGGLVATAPDDHGSEQ